MIDFLAAPSFQDGSGSAGCTDAGAGGGPGVDSLLQPVARNSHRTTTLQHCSDRFIVCRAARRSGYPYSALNRLMLLLAAIVTLSIAAYNSVALAFSLSASGLRLLTAPGLRSCPRYVTWSWSVFMNGP